MQVERLAKVRLALEARTRDPLAFWHFSSEQSRQATAYLTDFDEILARAANKAGKTEWAAATVLAMLQKRKTLDGVSLPQWRGKLDAIVLVLDYNEQKLSVQQTILRLLGQGSYRPLYKQGDILSSLLVKPVGERVSDDKTTWSTLSFMSQENKRAGLGARADIVWADEPPVEQIWREARKAAHAGRRMIRIISATPTIRRQWQWLKDEYGDGPRGQVRVVNQDWVEARWSLHDNSALSETEVEKLLREYRKDPLYDARVYGDYVDTSGLCPFDLTTLYAMLDECKEPQLHPFRITRESDGVPGGDTVVLVQVWSLADANKRYYIPVDASSGVDDDRHDPAALHVKEMGSGNTVARYSGHLGPYALGVLAAILARQYNNAVVDVEVNDGWGSGVLRGLDDSHYGNIGKQRRELMPGVWESEYGFRTTQTTRPRMISAVQSWVDAWRCGIHYGYCPSRDIIECLLDCILDENGKIVGGPGVHDEDFILHGQGLLRTVSGIGAAIPQYPKAPMTPEQRLIAEIRGIVTPETELAPVGVPLMIGRKAPIT